MKTFFVFLALGFAGIVCPLPAVERVGADVGAPVVERLLRLFPLYNGTMHTLSPEETANLLAVAADTGLNVFELLDGAYRYTARIGSRIVLDGQTLRAETAAFDMGGPRVDALLPIDKTERIEIGAILSAGQRAMDVYLNAPHSEFIELGTAVMDRRFGFGKIEPKLFSEAYGVAVKRFLISTVLQKLELYAPGKGAIYVQALNRPKRWNLDIVTRLTGAEAR